MTLRDLKKYVGDVLHFRIVLPIFVYGVYDGNDTYIMIIRPFWRTLFKWVGKPMTHAIIDTGTNKGIAYNDETVVERFGR